MTVMLLQRSMTLQLLHSNISRKFPFFIFLNLQDHAEIELSDNFKSVTSHFNSVTANNRSNRKIIEVITRLSTDRSASIDSSGIKKEEQNWFSKLDSIHHRRGHRAAIVFSNFAMRYYRLWIYACNVVLLVSAIGFVIAVARTFFFSNDPRRYLVPGIPRAHDPTALYAYLALTIQLGLVQLLGCIAAKYLSAKLLNAYWLLLLALLFGDIIIGVAWVFRFEKICANFRPILRLRLQVEYSEDTRFSERWDQLQRDYSCCGVTGPLDFGSQWPHSCCPLLSTTKKDYLHLLSAKDLPSDSNINETQSTIISVEPCSNPYTLGCEVQLMLWLKKTADLLFVLGFCVIAFTKLCFLGILRYEIREMIQKIRLLKEPPPTNTPFIQSLCPYPQQQISQENQFGSASVNDGSSIRRTTLPTVTSGITNGTMLRFVQEEESIHNKQALPPSFQDGNADSDTNSHCALIIEESSSPNQNLFQLIPKQRQDSKTTSSQASNILEMHEFNKRSLFCGVKSMSKPTSTSTTNSFIIPFQRT